MMILRKLIFCLFIINVFCTENRSENDINRIENREIKFAFLDTLKDACPVIKKRNYFKSSYHIYKKDTIGLFDELGFLDQFIFVANFNNNCNLKPIDILKKILLSRMPKEDSEYITNSCYKEMKATNVILKSYGEITYVKLNSIQNPGCSGFNGYLLINRSKGELLFIYADSLKFINNGIQLEFSIRGNKPSYRAIEYSMKNSLFTIIGYDY